MRLKFSTLLPIHGQGVRGLESTPLSVTGGVNGMRMQFVPPSLRNRGPSQTEESRGKTKSKDEKAHVEKSARAQEAKRKP